MKLDTALLTAIDNADLDRLLGLEVLLRVFVEHAPEGRAPFIEPYDLPTLLVLEGREQLLEHLDTFLEGAQAQEGTAVSMEVRPLPPVESAPGS